MIFFFDKDYAKIDEIVNYLHITSNNTTYNYQIILLESNNFYLDSEINIISNIDIFVLRI